MPIADLAVAALAAVAAARLLAASGRRAGLATAALLVSSPPTCSSSRSGVERRRGQRRLRGAARRASGPRARASALRAWIHYGSVYDYYQLQAPRERPGGYSTLVPRPAYDFYFLRNRLSCGVWLPGDEETLARRRRERRLPRRDVRAGRVPGAWFGWRALGSTAFARGSRRRVTMFSPTGAAELESPVPEPSRAAPRFCEGWNGRVMDERQAPFWVHGAGRCDSWSRRSRRRRRRSGSTERSSRGSRWPGGRPWRPSWTATWHASSSRCPPSSRRRRRRGSS